MNLHPKRSLALLGVTAVAVALGFRVLSDENLRERLGSTYTSLALMIAGVAFVFLTSRIRDRFAMNPHPKRSLALLGVTAVAVILGSYVISNENLRERLGGTNTSLVLLIAGVALVFLTSRIRDRLLERSSD